MIRADVSGQERRPFRFRDRGMLATIGRRAAVGRIAGLETSGFLAWMPWLTVQLVDAGGAQRAASIERRRPLEDLALARALHVVSVVIWIGGVAMVTTVLLPAIRSLPLADDPVAFFERIERRFAFEARIFTLLAGLSGFYMLHRMGAWSRYLSPQSWWLHAMTLVWLIFTVVLFVLEPLVLHRKLARRAERDPAGALALIQRAHWGLLALSLLAVAGAVAGSHGWSIG